MRSRRLLMPVVLAAAMALAVPPAGANHGDIVGEVSGNANVNMRLDGQPTYDADFSFSGLTITGAVVVGNQRFVGQMNVGTVFGKGTDCGLFGYGTIASQQAPGQFNGQNSLGNTVAGQFWGTFVRLGGKVDADLQVRVTTINGQTVNDQFPAYLDLTLFAPTNVDPSPPGTINQVAFHGEFHSKVNGPAPVPNPSC